MPVKCIEVFSEDATIRNSLAEFLQSEFPEIKVATSSALVTNNSPSVKLIAIASEKALDNLPDDLSQVFGITKWQLLVIDLSLVSANLLYKLFAIPTLEILHRSTGFKSLTDSTFKQELKRKTHFLTHLEPTELAQLQQQKKEFLPVQNRLLPYQLVVIGGSTGATDSLTELVAALPAAFPIPVVIVQHIPEKFTWRLASRLEGISKNRIVVPQNGEPLFAGAVYLLPSDRNMVLSSSINTNGQWIFGESNQKFQEYNFPSIDGFLGSVSSLKINRVVSVTLSGMGKDGAFGAEKIEKLHGKVIVQQPKECLAESMPLATKQQCNNVEVMSISEIAHFIKSIIGQSSTN